MADGTKVGSVYFEVGLDDKKLKASLDGAKRQVQASAQEIESAIDKAMNTRSGQTLVNRYQKATAEVNRLRQEIEKLKASGGDWTLTKEYASLDKQLGRVTDKMRKASDARASMITNGLEPTGKSRKEYEKLGNQLKVLEKEYHSVISAMQEMEQAGTATQTSSALNRLQMQLGKAEMNANLAGQALVNLASAEGEAGGQGETAGRRIASGALNVAKAWGGKAVNAFKTLGKSMLSAIAKAGQLGKSMLTAHKHSHKGIGKTLSQIVKWGLGIRSVFFLYRKIRKAIGEGFSNLTNVSPDTKANLDNLRASVLLLKNAFGALVAPIFNVVAPALSKLSEMLASVANTMGKFVSALTGKGFAVVAKKSFSGISDGADSAGSSLGNATDKAKELKRQLMGFDQINKLDEITDSNSGGSGGGGSGGGGADYSSMFETVEIDDATNNWVQKFKDSWAKADFSEIGSTVGTKINTSLGKIDWNKYKTTGTKLGKSLATFLNGIMQTTSWTLVGSSVAQGLNTAVNTAFAFASNFNWGGLGTTIGGAINGFVKDFDWAQAGRTLSTWALGILEACGTAIQTTDWKSLGEGIKTGLQSIEWSKIAGSAFNVLGSFAGAIAGLASGLLSSVVTKVKEYFSIKNLKELGGGNVVLGLLNGIKEGLKSIGSWIYNNIWVPFRDGFKKAFGIASPSKKMEELGGYLIDGLKNALTGIWDKVKSGFETFIKAVGNFFKDPIGTIKVAVDKGVEKAKELWDGIQNSEVVKTLKQTGKDVIEKAKTAWNGITNSEVVKTMTQTGEDVIEKAKSAWTAISNSKAVKTMSQTGKSIIDKAKATWNAITDSKAVKKLSEKGGSTITDFFKSTWSKITDGTATKKVKGKEDSTLETVKAKFDGITSNTALKTLDGSWTRMWNSAKALWNEIPESKTSTLKLDARVTSDYKKAVQNYNATANSNNKKLHMDIQQYAKGGAFYGGMWHKIPQAEKGGIFGHGTIFRAGEAGPEIVGHVGGRTEVLNASQLASAVASGVGRVLSKLTIRMPNPAPQLQFMERQSVQQTKANQRQAEDMRALMKLLTAMLQAIRDIDVDVFMDEDKVTNKLIKEINRRTRATGVSPFIL